MKLKSLIIRMLALTMFLFTLAWALTPSAWAQQPIGLKISSGAAGGTYNRMSADLATMCKAQGYFSNTNDAGGLGNLTDLLNRVSDGAFVPLDLLYAQKAAGADVSRIMILVVLHHEQLHFASPATIDKTTITGNMLSKFGIGNRDVRTRSSVGDLNGAVVGAYGASAITAEIFKAQSGINYHVVTFQTAAELKSAIAANAVDAVLYVGGAPLEPINQLPANWRLLGVDDATIGKLKATNLYEPDTISYGRRGVAVKTAAVRSVIAVRQPRGTTRKTELVNVRNCVYDAISDLADRTGVHPAWSSVPDRDQQKSTWPMVKID